ncbi:hypothetical protein ACJJTC_012861 [Scirpophaga incertulas]
MSIDKLSEFDVKCELSFNSVNEMMQSYLQPTPSALAERYHFRQRRQNVGENISLYVAELKKLAKLCKFGGNLNENLRDEFICGLRSDIIRQRLFAEDDTVTFSPAFELATSLEAAERDAAVVEAMMTISTGARETGSINVITQSHWRGRSSGDTNRSAGLASNRGYEASGGTNCEACGARNHNVTSCRFREYV